MLAEEGEEELIHERQEDDNGNWVEVLHQIVGNAVTSHLASLGDEVVGEVAVYDPIDGVEAKDLAGNKSTLDFINEVVVPESGGLLSKSGLIRRLCTIHLAGFDHLTHDTESVGDDRTLRWTDNVDFAAKDENESTDKENAQAHQVGRPEIDVAFHVWSCKQGQRTNVDALQVVSLTNRDSGICNLTQ